MFARRGLGKHNSFHKGILGNRGPGRGGMGERRENGTQGIYGRKGPWLGGEKSTFGMRVTMPNDVT